MSEKYVDLVRPSRGVLMGAVVDFVATMLALSWKRGAGADGCVTAGSCDGGVDPKTEASS